VWRHSRFLPPPPPFVLQLHDLFPGLPHSFYSVRGKEALKREGGREGGREREREVEEREGERGGRGGKKERERERRGGRLGEDGMGCGVQMH
jgi:hypothetical protein